MSRTTPRGTTSGSNPRHTPEHRRARRRQIVVGLVVAALVLSSGGAVVIAIIGSLGSSSTPSTPTLPNRPTVTSGPPVAVPLPAAGLTATGAVVCPPADGSGARTTSFEGPPPPCLATTADGSIDTGVSYRAVITTSVGDLTYLLTTRATPETVNSFVFLARYGYWDGAPFDTVVPLAWAETGGRFSAGNPTVADPGAAGPGWTVPRESPAQGMVSTPGMLAMAPTASGDSNPGRLVVALGEGAGDLPVPTTFFGVLLDGTATLAAIQRAGSLTGAPSQIVTIERITVEQG
jgi:cyclophilin family peptidyl-prolyl cis-trans isomerase